MSAASTTGCLPDPTPYDPCSDDDSQYYSVAPTGCDGHQLQVIYSIEHHNYSFAESNWITQPAGAYYGGLTPVMTRLVLDDADIYWRDLAGRVHQTSQTRSHEDIILDVPLNTVAVVGLSRDRAALNVLTIERTEDASMGQSAMVAVQLPARNVSEHASESLFLSDSNVTAVFPVQAGFVFMDASASLKLATFGDSDVLVLADGPIASFTAAENHVYYLRQGETAIRSLQLDDGSNRVLLQDSWLTYSQTQMITLGDGIAYYSCNSGYNSCSWTRVTDVGRTETLASGLALASDISSIADTQAFIAVTGIVGGTSYSNGPPGLYSWNLTDHSRAKLAKPFATVSGLALDAQYVYVGETSSDYVEVDNGESETVMTERMMRVRR